MRSNQEEGSSSQTAGALGDGYKRLEKKRKGSRRMSNMAESEIFETAEDCDETEKTLKRLAQNLSQESMALAVPPELRGEDEEVNECRDFFRCEEERKVYIVRDRTKLYEVDEANWSQKLIFTATSSIIAMAHFENLGMAVVASQTEFDLIRMFRTQKVATYAQVFKREYEESLCVGQMIQ